MVDKKKALNIVFMGTPGFAVPSLEKIIESGYRVVGVVTVADKPAGRGYKLQESEVKKAALKHGVPVMQPSDLADSSFLNQLRTLNTNLIVVVAFRKMPEELWRLPELGTFNLHGSLLPDYRGAAPLNWAVINGEKETGVTTFFLDEKIDTGALIDHAKIAIGENETVGQVHDKLMLIGADLVLHTIESIEKGEVKSVPQSKITVTKQIKKAPKIFKKDCQINWGKTAVEVYNLIRGLSPYPAAYTTLVHPNGKKMKVKIYESVSSSRNDSGAETDAVKGLAGKIQTDQKNHLKVYCSAGSIDVLTLQPEGKREMSVADFLRGKNLDGCIFS